LIKSNLTNSTFVIASRKQTDFTSIANRFGKGKNKTAMKNVLGTDKNDVVLAVPSIAYLAGDIAHANDSANINLDDIEEEEEPRPQDSESQLPASNIPAPDLSVIDSGSPVDDKKLLSDAVDVLKDEASVSAQENASESVEMSEFHSNTPNNSDDEDENTQLLTVPHSEDVLPNSRIGDIDKPEYQGVSSKPMDEAIQSYEKRTGKKFKPSQHQFDEEVILKRAGDGDIELTEFIKPNVSVHEEQNDEDEEKVDLQSDGEKPISESRPESSDEDENNPFNTDSESSPQEALLPVVGAEQEQERSEDESENEDEQQDEDEQEQEDESEQQDEEEKNKPIKEKIKEIVKETAKEKTNNNLSSLASSLAGLKDISILNKQQTTQGSDDIKPDLTLIDNPTRSRTLYNAIYENPHVIMTLFGVVFYGVYSIYKCQNPKKVTKPKKKPTTTKHSKQLPTDTSKTTSQKPPATSSVHTQAIVSTSTTEQTRQGFASEQSSRVNTTKPKKKTKPTAGQSIIKRSGLKPAQKPNPPPQQNPPVVVMENPIHQSRGFGGIALRNPFQR